MGRVYRIRTPTLEETLRQVNAIFAAPMFGEIRRIAEDRARLLVESPAGSATFVKWLEAMEKLFSKHPSPRCAADAWLVSDSAATIGKSAKLSKALIPFYLGEWLYFVPPQPFDSTAPGYTFYGISFPGNDNVHDMHLLRYPWLVHEIGHHFLDCVNHSVLSPINEHLQKHIRKERRRLHSASPEIRHLIEERTGLYSDYWSPEKHRQNWAVEIFADVISIWICGPAFLASFTEDMEKGSSNPFEIAGTHPPVDLRVQLLLVAAEKLGWDEDSAHLRKLQDSWRCASCPPDYHIFSDKEFGIFVLETALSVCNRFNFPKCTKQIIDEARHWVSAAQSCNSALQLIIGSWLKEKEDPNHFQSWEDAVISILIEESQGNT